jgi:hypothetical protein
MISRSRLSWYSITHLVGLENDAALWESARFRIVAWNSVVYTVGSNQCTRWAPFRGSGGNLMTATSVIVGSTRQGRFSEKPAQWILQPQ